MPVQRRQSARAGSPAALQHRSPWGILGRNLHGYCHEKSVVPLRRPSMEMIDQLLARAEADLEVATRRREIAQTIAPDWAWWGPLFNSAVVPQDEREAVAGPAPPWRSPPRPSRTPPSAGNAAARYRLGRAVVAVGRGPSARRSVAMRGTRSALCSASGQRPRKRPQRSSCRPTHYRISDRRSGRCRVGNTRITGCRSSCGCPGSRGNGGRKPIDGRAVSLPPVVHV
jgi:hypothetical protein